MRWIGRRGANAGIWQLLFTPPAVDADTEWLEDRCHPHSRPSTRRGRNRGQPTQAEGRCLGGVTPKLQAVCEAWGHPRRFIVPGGERHDGPQAQARLEGCHAHAVRADTGDEAEALVTGSQPTGAMALIAPRSNRTVLRAYNTARSFPLFVQLAASDVWRK
ncbi:MAG: hypothetical protein ABI988_05075 [Nitrospirota bacterium]